MMPSERDLSLTDFDPLFTDQSRQLELSEDIQRRTIRNILKSYTGYYDLFSELIQNALDAVDLKSRDSVEGYQPILKIHIDQRNQEVTVEDNGIGISKEQLLLFLQPNITFKGTKKKTRGNKGVGATFLAYGFNRMFVSTKTSDFTFTGVIEGGRDWIDDDDGIVLKPKMRIVDQSSNLFETGNVSTGTTFKIMLKGKTVRPKDLSWFQASTADQWAGVLRIKTPLGGLDFATAEFPKTHCHITVTADDGTVTTTNLDKCQFYYPHNIPGCRFVTLSELKKRKVEASREGRPMQSQQQYYRLHGIYDVFSAEDLLSSSSEFINVFSDDQVELIKAHSPDVYAFFGYSPQLWDTFNDNILQLRKKKRILDGGLLLGTQTMTQGDQLVIPLKRYIGYQNQTLVLVHYRTAEPDLGRKGFQPELVELGEKIATSVVEIFRKYLEHLRKDSGEPLLAADAKRHEWIKKQESWANTNPLTIRGSWLFAPEESLPIVSVPSLEQDVVGLFHQLLASGVIRGYNILATSENMQYDGVFRATIESTPKYIFDATKNPLGVPVENISPATTEPKILEYKYDLDSLIRDFDRGDKHEKHIDLVVVWTAGEKWKERYQANPLLHFDFIHQRHLHGVTHDFLNYQTGERVFYGIVLDELIRYLNNPIVIQDELREKYID